MNAIASVVWVMTLSMEYVHGSVVRADEAHQDMFSTASRATRSTATHGSQMEEEHKNGKAATPDEGTQGVLDLLCVPKDPNKKSRA